MFILLIFAQLDNIRTKIGATNQLGKDSKATTLYRFV